MALRNALRAASIAVAAACGGAQAPPPLPPGPAAGWRAPPLGRPADAERAMARLAALEGEWIAVEGGQEFPARIERIARGTAVIQHSVFVAVYHRDGGTLLVTLFPDDGYSPRLRSPGLAEGADQLEFTFVDASNLAPGADSRPAGMTMEWRGDGEVVQRWRWLDHGVEQPFEVRLRRKPAP